MNTKIIKITDDITLQEAVGEAVELIRSGAPVAFPTETVYGLGADCFSEKACRSIYEAKGRPENKALTLHIAEEKTLFDVALEVNEAAMKLFRSFMPGPLTLILKKRSHIPDFVTAGKDTVGIRFPDNKIARALIKSAGVPLVAPSANLSGHKPPVAAAEAYDELKGRIPLILDGGICPVGTSSTIVDCTGEVPEIKRRGAITAEMIRLVLGVP